MADAQKVLRVGFTAEMRHLDPVTANDVESMFVLRQVVEAPFEVPPGTAAIEPALFAGPLEKTDAAARSFRARVKPGIHFSDGEELTAAHIAASLRAATPTAHTEIEAEGDSVLFRLEHPDSRFDITLSHGSCSITRKQGSQLLGTGPFAIHPESRPQEVRLVRNPHAREPSRLDEIVFRAFPTDAQGRPTALLEAIEKGEIDFTTGLRRDDTASLRRVRKSFRPGGSTSFLFFNTQSEPLREPAVRRALACSVNRMEVTETCYDNALAYTAAGPLPRNLGSASDGLVHDPWRAGKALEAAGARFPERLRLLVVWGPRTYLPQPAVVAEELRRQLSAQGIAVELQLTSSSSEFFQGVIDGHYDAVLAGWTADTLDPCDFLESILLSERVPTWQNLAVSANHARYASEALDALLARYRARRGIGDLDAVMEKLSEDAPFVPLMYGSMAAIMGFRVKGFEPCSLPVFSLANLDL